MRTISLLQTGQSTLLQLPPMTFSLCRGIIAGDLQKWLAIRIVITYYSRRALANK